LVETASEEKTNTCLNPIEPVKGGGESRWEGPRGGGEKKKEGRSSSPGAYEKKVGNINILREDSPTYISGDKLDWGGGGGLPEKERLTY